MWDWSENQMMLVLIRHGVTKANREHRYLGTTDEPLCGEGIRQLTEYQKLRLYPEINCLFASPMRRCLQTAEILFPELSPVVIPEWKEIDFGIFEGKHHLELQEEKRYQAWLDSQGTLPFPEGESREEFLFRCDKGFRKMIEKIKEKKEENKVIGMMVHGGTIMALLSQYGQGEYFDYQAANGRGYVCTIKNWDRKPEVVKLEKL